MPVVVVCVPRTQSLVLEPHWAMQQGRVSLAEDPVVRARVTPDQGTSWPFDTDVIRLLAGVVYGIIISTGAHTHHSGSRHLAKPRTQDFLPPQ